MSAIAVKPTTMLTVISVIFMPINVVEELAKPIDYFGPAPDESQAARNAAASS